MTIEKVIEMLQSIRDKKPFIASYRILKDYNDFIKDYNFRLTDFLEKCKEADDFEYIKIENKVIKGE